LRCATKLFLYFSVGLIDWGVAMQGMTQWESS
jgi:hypothetical protein